MNSILQNRKRAAGRRIYDWNTFRIPTSTSDGSTLPVQVRVSSTADPRNPHYPKTPYWIWRSTDSTMAKPSGVPIKLTGGREVAICGAGSLGITLTGRSITMQITSKGQVTIPQEVRNRLGLLPHTKVEFELAGDHARIRKARRQPGEDTRGRLVLEALRGSADTRMSTAEILALTRSEPRRTKRRRA
jgi:antitoxin PrlF